VECDIWRVSAVVNVVGAVVKSAPNHEYFFNVSTGAKTACIGGTIGAMLWGVTPYYQALDYAGRADELKEEFSTKGEPQLIPTFEARGLEASDLKALEAISRGGGSTAKRGLLDDLKSEGLIGPKREGTGSQQAYYGQLKSILDRLETWGFIEIRGKGKRALIVLTQAGKEGATMFRHESHSIPSLPRLDN
jgi:hypothetical protein